MPSISASRSARAAPTQAMVDLCNENICCVFGDRGRKWDMKAIMAWAWPSIELTGAALEHYKTGPIAAHQRDTTRLLNAALFDQPNGSADLQLFSIFTNRFNELDGPLRAAAALLGTIIREGVIIKLEDGKWAQRELATLFESIDTTHGKDAPKGADDSYKIGDPLSITIFDKPDNLDQTFEIEYDFGVASDDPGYKIQKVKLDALGNFMFNIGEKAMTAALKEIEKALPTKPRKYAAKKGSGSGSSGAKRLSKDGHACVLKLKNLLPEVRLNELKKMYATAGLGAVPDGATKEILVAAIIEHCLPGYPQETPRRRTLMGFSPKKSSLRLWRRELVPSLVPPAHSMRGGGTHLVLLIWCEQVVPT